MAPEIVIVGCGSVGLLLAALLSRGGKAPLLACRRLEQALLVSEKGVVVAEAGGEGVAKIEAILVDDIPPRSVEALVVAVKAYHVPGIAVKAREWLGERGVAVTVQNGLGSYEELAEVLGEDRVVYMGLYIGARRLGDNRVEYTGGRRAVIGPLGGWRAESQEEVARRIASALEAAGLEALVVEDAEPWRWDKLVVNAAINPVTAVLGATNSIVYENPYAKQLALAAAQEAAAVAEIVGVKLPRNPVEAVIETAKATRSNRSSMLQDIEARRKTEIDYINGAVARIGEENGVYTPVNYTLYLEVKALEKLLHIED